MTKSSFRLSVFSFFIFLTFINCTRKKTALAWEQNFPVIGSQSSPRATDLNGDGVLDIVMGAGQNEYQESEQGVLALNGKTGEVLWQQKATDQVFGSPTLIDINDDQVQDIIIGGRGCQLMALDGKTGRKIWQYEYRFQDDPVLQYARANFYNGVLVPDQNRDGLADLLIQNGGNPKAAPYSEYGRFPGVLLLLDSKTGQVIAADTMPDGRESYMSPLFFTQPDGEEMIVFGSGGETLNGHLYLTKLSDLKAGDLSGAKVIASEEGHGFIAPPVAADINQDGYYDIVAISHASSVFAIDGKDQKVLWQQKIPNTESSNSFAAGYFTEDKTPDFFTFVSKGEWPNNTGSLQVLFDGRTGEIAYLDSIGCTGFSSPVAFDLNKDGREEVIISVNEFDCMQAYVDNEITSIQNRLIAINFADHTVNPIDQLNGFKNIFTTPWIGDLDRDGYLDIVYCQYYNPSSYLLAFLGMRVKRISTSVPAKQVPVWGAYRGTTGEGVF